MPTWRDCCINSIGINKCNNGLEISKCLNCGNIQRLIIKPEYCKKEEFCIKINKSLYNFLMEVI